MYKPQPKSDAEGSLFRKLFNAEVQHIEDVPKTDLTPKGAAELKNAQEISLAFTKFVESLRSDPGFSPRIHDLGKLFYDLVGFRVTPVWLGPEVQAVNFWAEVPRNGKPFACVLCPHNWLSMIQSSPIMQLGAVTFAASQARDFYNEKLEDKEGVRSRSRAFESELLRCFCRHKVITPEMLNSHQRKLLEEFPNGLDSLNSALWYESRPFNETFKPYCR